MTHATPDHMVRSATAADERLLRRMLVFAAFPPGADSLRPERILEDERLARYLAGWGRPGDAGVVAEADGEPIGAAWYRRFSPDAPGHGFVSEDAPELSIAVAPTWRNRGVGRALLLALIKHAREEGEAAISLSVSRHNRAAVQLYASVGFRPVAGDEDHPTMLLELASGRGSGGRTVVGSQPDQSGTSTADRERLRLTFGTDAERYDRMRPGYPAQLFDDLAKLACIGPGCRVLEIGVGTGQATIPLVERGCQLVGVELSSELAAIARRKLEPFLDASITISSFEAWPLPAEPFDAVVSATAFHWIDPETRVMKAADALRPVGALATIGTHHVAGGSAEFFEQVQACYEHWDPGTPVGLRLPVADDIPSSSEELDRSRRFVPATFHRYEWEVAYSTAEYRDLLLTYSGHITLEPSARAGLLGCITDLIDASFGGRITKRYLTELRVANKRQEG